MDLLTDLEYEARTSRPTLFALVGVGRGDDDPGYVAWGLEFTEPRAAVLWTEDGGTWVSQSAATLLARHRVLGEAKLVTFPE
ncbi:hypothetical protein [Saccharothrix obliqua]|uniref:hypothetical protein n=1 Tax=Saccharothrix obliqua TaxID=2861747 RepID=UPI001C5E3991|nr:hypothetical protein [Saccharothrix obliqua]MBW4719114.1 hypothetical protein [Saccharothrix obliqua]